MKKLKLSVFLIGLVLISCTTSNIEENYLNPNLPTEKRVELLLKKMTLDDKIGQMCQYIGEPTENTTGNKDEEVPFALRLGEREHLIKEGKIGSFLKVPTYKEANYLQKLAEQSPLKIPLLIATDAIHGHGMYKAGSTTIYPNQINIASTFDTIIAKKIAKYTAAEMRATGYHWTFSPNIEIVRDARWGRIGETFGEDPLLVAMMGKVMIEGYQGEDFSGANNVLSCAKHFVAGGTAFNGLNGAPADISERTLHEIFFPPFIEAINANTYSIMPAHNEINGIPCHAHQKYLTGLIRNTWGFKGFFVSDWMDIERLHNTHKIAESIKEADRIAVLAGLDVHMQGPNFFSNVKELVEEGKIPIERIDEAASKILYAKFQLGLFENRYVDSVQIRSRLLKKEHLDLALETARKSIVLLQNKNNILPLDKDVKSIFISGPNANSQALLGDWARIQPEENVITVLEGLQKSVSVNTKIDYLSWNRFDTISDDILRKAKTRASKCDIAIVVVGENTIRFDKDKTSGENVDRSTLELAGTQMKLVKSIESSGTPVIVVLVNNGPIASPWMVNNTDAIIEAWEPGMLGGQAVADVIFGNYNPSGKLPITIPYSVGNIQSFYNYKPSAFHRGRFYLSNKEPLFEFGYGLSFTEFKYSDLKTPETININDDVEISVSIENTGAYDGDEVILIYINDVVSSVTTPVKKLVAFKRVHIKSGKKQVVEFTIPNNSFKIFDENMSNILEPGLFDIIVGNNLVRGSIIFE